MSQYLHFQDRHIISTILYSELFCKVQNMPVNHQLYSEWDKARFLKWSSGIGKSTNQVVQGIFDSYRIEEQAYKGCLSLPKLADYSGSVVKTKI